jgi:hypothetical protein
MRRINELQSRLYKEKLFEEIINKYGDKVIVNISEFCDNCKFECDCRLLPVTTTGNNCPYYRHGISGHYIV